MSANLAFQTASISVLISRRYALYSSISRDRFKEEEEEYPF
jgi:hypothetical protein